MYLKNGVMDGVEVEHRKNERDLFLNHSCVIIEYEQKAVLALGTCNINLGCSTSSFKYSNVLQAKCWL